LYELYIHTYIIIVVSPQSQQNCNTVCLTKGVFDEIECVTNMYVNTKTKNPGRSQSIRNSPTQCWWPVPDDPIGIGWSFDLRQTESTRRWDRSLEVFEKIGSDRTSRERWCAPNRVPPPPPPQACVCNAIAPTPAGTFEIGRTTTSREVGSQRLSPRFIQCPRGRWK